MNSIFRAATLLSLLLFCLSFAACSKEADKDVTNREGQVRDTPVIYTVNYPLKYFADRIGGEHMEAVFPAMEGDPAYWVPDAEAVQAYQQADLILLNGAQYAKWVEKATLPEAKLVDTSSGFHDQYILLDGTVTHSHGPDGDHAHAGAAFTTWLNLSHANAHAKAIMQAFSVIKPDQKEAFKANFDALKIDLMELDQSLRKVLASKADQPLVGSHPVYQYLTNQYGLNLKSLHWEPDETPTADQWTELDKLLADHPAKWMIWEGEPGSDTVKALKEKGMDSAVFDPCGNVPEEGDFLAVMKSNVENLKAVFQ